MKRVLVTLLMMPLALFGKGSPPTQAATDQDFIVSNYEVDEENAWSDSGRILINEEEEEAPYTPPPTPKVTIDLKQVFRGSPVIYSLLLILSMTSVFLWLYTLLRWRVLAGYTDPFRKRVRDLLSTHKWNEAFLLCRNKNDLLSRMVLASLASEGTSRKELEEVVSFEVKRASSATWQRIGILNDIAIIAPMLGLMGTVLGMFYAFYDINRSLDSITKLFDGLGISVATTVAGLCVALLSLLLHTFLKHRLIRRLSVIEQEAEVLIPLVAKKEGRPQ